MAREQSTIVYQSGDFPAHGKAFQVKSETVVFEDEEKGTTLAMDGVTLPDHINEQVVTDTTLEKFFARPVRVATYTWNESDPIGTQRSIGIWKEYFTNSRIAHKLETFAYLRCDLHVKILINASPFYYGAMCVNYTPLPRSGNYDSLYQDAGGKWFIPFSQRPHCWIYPQANEGCEMVLPFFYPVNWLDTSSASDFNLMGVLELVNFTALQSANGVTGSGVTIQVYAWASNVRLAGPTLGPVLQSKDEYAGSISGPASSVAQVASTLKDVPAIGTLAKATELTAKGVAGAAKVLGYSNTPIQEDIRSMRPSTVPDLSTSEIGCQLKKLTLDPRNELSIDPQVTGLKSVDETDISYLVQKESYLCTTTMSTAHLPDRILFTSNVTPSLWDFYQESGQNVIQQTVTSFVSQMFMHWRGDMIFRFKFIVSPYHKGRVRISFDPSGSSSSNIVNTAESSNAIFTRVVDIGKEDNVEFRVPYLRARAWLTTLTANNTEPWSTDSAPTFSSDTTSFNGTICMRVLTALTAPILTSSIPIMVFVRGAENLEFANPHFSIGGIQRYSYFTVQSQDELVTKEEVKSMEVTVPHVPRDIHLYYFGEAVGNIKQILRRSVLVDVLTVPSSFSTSNYHAYVNWNCPKMPPTPGYESSGLYKAVGIKVPGSEFGYNFANFTPLAYFVGAFVGMRGSVVWHLTRNSAQSPGGMIMRATRIPNTAVTFSRESIAQTVSSASTSVLANYFISKLKTGSAGTSMVATHIEPTLSIHVPHMTPFLFYETGPNQGNDPTYYDGAAYDGYKFEMSVPTTSSLAPIEVFRHCSIGTDWNVHFFLSVPTLFYYDSVPVPSSTV